MSGADAAISAALMAPERCGSDIWSAVADPTALSDIWSARGGPYLQIGACPTTIVGAMPYLRIVLVTMAASLSLAFAEVPPPTLFDTDWGDRSDFEAALIDPAELAHVPDADVYHLHLDLARDLRYVWGELELHFTNRGGEPLDAVVLRLLPNVLGSEMDVSGVRVNGRGVGWTLEADGSALRVHLREALEPGGSLILRADFSVEVAVEPVTAYGRLGRFEDALSLAHGYPLAAVFDEESAEWDTRIPAEYGDPLFAEVALYRVRVDAPAEVKLIGTGAKVERELLGDRQQVTFAVGPARDFYLAAVEDYVEQRLSLGPVTIRSFTPAELAFGAWHGLNVAREALALFERSYGPYPYRELDIVAIPVTAGGIEYSGVLTVANSFYVEPDGFFETIIVHEVAHQWFYLLVGNDQLGEPWLDEALTQYATWRYYREVRGEAAAAEFRAYLLDTWAGAGFEELPIGLPVEAYTPEEYGAILYGRGPLFFEALEGELGASLVEDILRDYAKRYRWRIATGEDLQRVAEEHCECDLTPLFDEWLRGVAR